MTNVEGLRKELIAYCTNFIESQINHVQEVINSAKESAKDESKSSAGDKHETGKSLLQLEQENNAILLNNMLTQKPVIKWLENYKSSNEIGLGSIIETNMGIYFIAIGIGMVKLNSASYFVISPTAPVGKLFAGKKQGDTVTFNGKTIEILNVG